MSPCCNCRRCANAVKTSRSCSTTSCCKLPPSTTAFSIATDAHLDTRIIPESYVLLRGVPTLPFASQYTDGTAVAKMVTPDTPVLLFQNNGALTVGGSVLEAFDRMEVLENTAKVLIAARALGPVQTIGSDGITAIEQAFLNC